MKPGDVETLAIESLAYRGEGVGRLQDKVVFVPLTAPGDLVDVAISEDKRSYLRGSAEHLRSRSPHRVVPICDHFGECGGCHWQHLEYPFQVEAKQLILQETLTRLGKVSPDTYQSLPPIPSPRPFGYRCRIRLQCSTRRRTHIGFFRSQTNEIVPVERCELASAFVNDILKRLHEFLNSLDYFMPFQEVEILANPGLEEAVLSFSGPGSADEERTRDFLRALKVHIPKVYGASLETIQGSESRSEYFGNCELTFRTLLASPGMNPQTIETRTHLRGFTQVNPEQNENLQRVVYEWASPTKEQVIADLFCGAGNLSLPLARDSRKIIGFESNPVAVEGARLNAERNGLTNCQFHEVDILTSNLDILKAEPAVDILLLDPPRRGAKDCLSRIATLHPLKIIYVSCNPTTLARDAFLLSGSGYRLRRVQMLDMFPQTYHLECIAEFLPSH